MNKTLSIGLAGYSFIIEELAYTKLNNYLNALRNSLEASEVEEVMHDIEIRIVEIFRESLGSREVVNDTDVQKVIAQLGTPEVIEEQEEAYYSDNAKSKENKQKRQLFRDPENTKISGVCSGLAHYVGMDIAIMRGIWLFIAIMGVFTAAISTSIVVLIYIVLAVVIPVANSTSDFLKMKGRPINFDTIKEESSKLMQFANESSEKVGEFYSNNKKEIGNVGNSIWKAVRYCIGIFAVICGLGCLAGVGLGVSVLVGDVDIAPALEIDFYFDNNFNKYILSMVIILASLLPALLFMMLAIKCFSPKTSVKVLGWLTAVVFFLTIGASIFFGVKMMSFKESANFINNGEKIDTEEILINTTSDTLYVDVKQVDIPKNFVSYKENGKIFSDKKEVYERLNNHDFEINITRKPNINAPYLIVKKEANGYNQPIRLRVPLEVSGNRILLPNYINYAYSERFRGYDVSYELAVPQDFKVIAQNTKIYIDDDFSQTNQTAPNSNQTYKHETSSVNINGVQIDFDSHNPNTIKINGKDYTPTDAERYVEDSLQLDITDLLHIDINNGKVSVKTK